MRLGGKRPQMTRQLELPLANRGEAPTGKRSEEAPTATHGNERSGASDLMEKVCEGTCQESCVHGYASSSSNRT